MLSVFGLYELCGAILHCVEMFSGFERSVSSLSCVLIGRCSELVKPNFVFREAEGIVCFGSSQNMLWKRMMFVHSCKHCALSLAFGYF